MKKAFRKMSEENLSVRGPQLLEEVASEEFRIIYRKSN